MNISKSAITYANSLIEADNNYEQILKDLQAVSETVQESKDFAEIMSNPTIAIQTKNEIIDEIFKNKINNKVINFIKILADKKRFDELNAVIKAYINKVDEINNIKRVEVISAVELSSNQKEKTIEKLQTKLQKSVLVNWTQNKDIIGGLVIKIDDDVIDNSLKNKLEKLSKI